MNPASPAEAPAGGSSAEAPAGGSSAEPPAGGFAVLLATHNGARWIDDQLLSIYSQVGVRTTVIASDDGSVDDTRERLQAWAARKPLHLLGPAPGRLGSANRNFLRLIRDAPIGAATHVGLADQDDIWADDKCQRACTELARCHADAYSSDVTAFWPDGRRKRLRKSGGARRYDHLFESAGPGCTFVFTRAGFDRLRRWVQLHFEALQDIKVHDWLIYAYARTQGWPWVLDPRPGLLYRQHGANELGANVGPKAILARLGNVHRGAYRRDVLRIAAAVDDRSWVARALTRFDLRDRLRLAASVGEFRRRPRDRALLAVFFLTMRRS